MILYRILATVSIIVLHIFSSKLVRTLLYFLSHLKMNALTQTDRTPDYSNPPLCLRGPGLTRYIINILWPVRPSL